MLVIDIEKPHPEVLSQPSLISHPGHGALDNSWTDLYTLISMLKGHPITTFLLFNAACRQTLDSGHPQPEEFRKQRYIQLLDAISLWRPQSAIRDSYPSLDNQEIMRLPLAPKDLRCSNAEAAIRKRWNQQSEDQVEAWWHTSLRKKSSGLIGIKGIKDLYYIDLKRFCLHLQVPAMMLSPLDRLQFVPKRNILITRATFSNLKLI